VSDPAPGPGEPAPGRPEPAPAAGPEPAPAAGPEPGPAAGSEPAPAAGPEPAPLARAPFRAWLVTGPAGRLVGFLIDFARALRAHLAAKRQNVRQ